MSNDQILNVSKIGDYSINLIEAIDNEIKEYSDSNVEQLPGIKLNLDLLLRNERLIKEEIWTTRCKELNLLEESELGDPSTSSTYEGKVAEILRTCMNNLMILRATRTATAAEEQIAVLQSLIRNHENINKKVQHILMKYTQDQQSDSMEEDNISSTSLSEETLDKEGWTASSSQVGFQIRNLHCGKILQHERREICIAEQEKREPFDIMHNYAMPFSAYLQRDEDAAASSGYRCFILTKLLDDECTIRHMMGLEDKTIISDIKRDGVRRESFLFFLNTGIDFHFRKNIVYVAMLTIHKFLEARIISKKRLKLLRYACLSLAAKLNQLGYNEVEELLKHFKSQLGIDGETLGRMELSVLRTLKWEIHVVTPFVFTMFFLSRFCAHYSLDESTKDTIRIKSDKIVLKVVAEGNLLKYCPSQIAAGAILLALDATLTKEAFKTLPLKGFFNIDALFTCYGELRNLMKVSS